MITTPLSCLSVEAKEFVPKQTASPQPYSTEHQDGATGYKMQACIKHTGKKGHNPTEYYGVRGSNHQIPRFYNPAIKPAVSFPPQWIPPAPPACMPPFQQGLQGMPFDGGTPMMQSNNLLQYMPYPPSNVNNIAFMQGNMGVQQQNYANYGAHPTVPGTVNANLGPKYNQNFTNSQQQWNPKNKVAERESPCVHAKESRRSGINTCILKEVSVQTEFSEELENLSLSQRPNSLFCHSCEHLMARERYSSDSELDSDSGYSSPLHRKNQVSNSTQTFTFQHGFSPTVPRTNPLTHSGTANCSKSTIITDSFEQSNKTVCPMPPEHRPVPSKLSYAAIIQKKPEVKDQAINNSICDNKETICDKSEGNNEPADLEENDSAVKKKRKRSRRRKKKTGTGEHPPGILPVPVETLTPKTVTFQLEDDEDFPGLTGSGCESQRTAPFSYSDALKVPPGAKREMRVKERAVIPESEPVMETEVKANLEEASPLDNIDTKSARKRRKRRENANKAAEEELAEINIEQQMLREMNRKQKQSDILPLPGKTTANTKQETKSKPTGKKSKQPIAMDIGAMIDALEKKKSSSQPETSKISKKQEDVKKSQKTVAHNPLDASAPKKRGKERENPKPKKPSPLKKVILKEREEKKRMRLLDEGGHAAPVGIGVVSAESDLSQDAGSSKGSGDLGAASTELSPISQPSPFNMSPLSPGPSPMNSGVNSPIMGLTTKDINPVKMKIHSRRFREYCNQVLDKEIDNCCVTLLQDLVRFQDRLYHKDPIKAKSKRRIVLGLREVTKHLRLKKIKCVMISPNLEKIQSKGGLDEALYNILDLCQEQHLPFVFALGRKALGRACAKLVPVSVVGIFNYDGSEENFKKLMDLTEKAREQYTEMVDLIEQEIQEEMLKMASPLSNHIYAHMGHSRTPSGCSAISFTSSILSEPISENYPHSEPETDSRGYEIVKEPVEHQLRAARNNAPNDKPAAEKSVTMRTDLTEFDDGNEADDEDGNEEPLKENVIGGRTLKTGEGLFKNIEASESKLADNGDDSGTNGDGSVKYRTSSSGDDSVDDEIDSNDDDYSDADEHISEHESDIVNELPHIDSIHDTHIDLGAEIMSQHSVRTLDNSEVLSTHSSKTLGDGSSTLLAEHHGKSSDSVGGTQRHRIIDKERIQNWVEASQNRLEEHNPEEAQTEDGSDSETDSVEKQEVKSDSTETSDSQQSDDAS